MKRKFFKAKYAALLGVALVALTLFAFSSRKQTIKTNTPVEVVVPPPCTLNPSCAQAEANLQATYKNSNGDKCEAVRITVNGILQAHCYQCPGTFDPCGLRQYAINAFPSCHFTMSSFISHCP